MRKLLYAAAAATALISTAALATVNFDFGTGTGFVGKGDVQTAFTWNNAKLQQNASGVTFYIDDTATYDAVCTWDTGTGTPGFQEHNVTIPRHVSVDASIAYDPRIHSQIDGFNLSGFGDTTSSSGAIPVVGAACVGNSDGVDHNGTWSAVTLESSSGGGLYVSYGGTNVLLLAE